MSSPQPSPPAPPARALITGAGGFAGRHLLAYLHTVTGWELYGNVHRMPGSWLGAERSWSLAPADLTDRAQVAGMVDRVRPDYVFHLAAQSNVPEAFRHPESTITNNILSQLNLLESLRETYPGARVLVVCSSEQYGLVRPQDIPIDEDTPFRPNNPYAVSKIAQDALALEHFLAYGQKTIRVRPFNHIGPGQQENFVAAAFARQIARIEKGLQEPVLFVGNLDAARDFTDVRDMVRAYHLAVTAGEPGEVYNVGSGQGRTMQWLLDTLLSRSQVKVEVRQDPARMRPSDIPILVCDNTRFVRQTGWQPRIPLDQTLSDVLDYWRQKEEI
ncbi:MAG: GDP-mannose 4,6-dehydratase [Chloroflexia bacterium]